MALSPTLSWQAMTGALWYGYCYDTTDNDACDPGSWQDAETATSAGLTGLAPSTTYYWQVFASTSSLPVYGDGGEWWSFTTGAAVSQQMTFHSTGTYDGWVLESGETSGIGGSRNATATTARLGDDASDRQYRSLLHFDTTGLPDNAVITGVTLRIKKQSVVGTSPFSTHGSLTVDARTGSFGTAALANADFKAAASGLNVGKFAKTAVSGWYRATLKTAVFPLVNRVGTTQFRLRFTIDDNDDRATDYLAFYTGDSTAANRPEPDHHLLPALEKTGPTPVPALRAGPPRPEGEEQIAPVRPVGARNATPRREPGARRWAGASQRAGLSGRLAERLGRLRAGRHRCPIPARVHRLSSGGEP